MAYRVCGGLVLLAASLALSAGSYAQGGVRSVSVVGGPVVLTLGADSHFGGGQLSMSDESSGLQWRTGPQNQKIVVSSTAPGQVFELRVQAFNVSGMGVPQPAIVLTDSMPPQDLIRDLNTTPGPTNGAATLRYTAGATISQGNSNEVGVDSHHITFTITDQ